MASRLWKAYEAVMKAHPWKTKIISTGVICGCGDVISQVAIERRNLSTYQPSRTLRFFALGSIWIAPTIHNWFILLEKIRGPAMIVPLQRLVVDQICFAPWMLSSIIILLKVFENGSFEKAIAFWRTNIWEIYKNGLKVWPATQLINFYLIPLQYRLLVVQTVALFWNTYLAYATKGTHPGVEHTLPELLETSL